ncbi:TetR/AcrR family transcriptional regulator [Streptomyces zagrosensis]|uniref:AcrR family transcriptional regulator n=1 Tax=Streptomyces zagrosensis TaxID=1042984 RepID=A0A7W9QC27_9ACTN|nr:TetR/AcrR family transcriptional regulator [Streptomyces zagrosensis]MBB5937018.1 AcrR family transcriptional regulator [Streptomyces zagrosensis]
MKTKAQHDEDTVEQGPLGTRERIVRTASRLMQRQGYEASGVKQISQEAGATLGSLYHFFPGGKQQLAAEAIRHGDREFADILGEMLDSRPDPAGAIDDCAVALAEGLHASAWLDGCPVTATALGAAGHLPDIQRAAAEAFQRWRELVYEKLRGAGIAEDEARELASTVISTLEGAEMAAQVARSEEPLRAAGRQLARLINSYR